MPKKFLRDPAPPWEALPRDASFGVDGRGVRQVSDVPESPWLVPRTTVFCPDCHRLNEIDGIICVEVPRGHSGTVVDAMLECNHRVKFVGSMAYRGLRVKEGSRWAISRLGVGL